jgi:Ca-activated chloride channel homolog
MSRHSAECYNLATMKSIGFLSLALLLAITAGAQSQAPVLPRQDDPLIVNVDLDDVLFTVADNKGKLITDLTREHFRVYEDNKLQDITTFTSETNLPLTIALLVDTSGSIREKLKFEQEAAIEFFYSTLRKGKDKALVISFDSGVDLLTKDAGGPGEDFTDDPEKLADAVRKIRAGGGTALYDAVYLAVLEKLAKDTNEESRKLIILISDGDDNSSRISLTETLEVAQKSNVAIYSISTNQTAYFGSSNQERGDKTLRRMSDETGGRAFFPFKIEELAANFQGIGEELRSQYTLAYFSTNTRRDGGFRRIRIEPTDKKYKPRHRTGYYSPRASAAVVQP